MISYVITFWIDSEVIKKTLSVKNETDIIEYAKIVSLELSENYLLKFGKSPSIHYEYRTKEQMLESLLKKETCIT